MSCLRLSSTSSSSILTMVAVIVVVSLPPPTRCDRQLTLSPAHFQHLDRRGIHNSSSPQHFFVTSSMIKTIDDYVLTGGRRRQKREEISDALSQNVTMILEDLLQDYDQTERPDYHTGQATKVKINILIRSMGPISEEDMNYSMDCYFRQYWRDERLSFTGLKNNAHSLSINHLSLNIKMLEKIWKPDTYFHNGLSSYLHTITRPNKLLRISEHGDITYSMRLTIKAKCPMVLRSFPMDWQSCPLIIGSFAYTSDEVEYIWSDPENAVSYEGKLELSQFDIRQTSFRSLNFSRSGYETYSVLQVVIALQRHTGYFLIQIYLPCTLLVILSWVGFWLNREATSDRVGLGITTVLTLSTIALESRTDLPKVHYATALDWFIICSFAYCIATLLEFAGVHYFTKVGSGEIFSIEEVSSSIDDEEDLDNGDLEQDDSHADLPTDADGRSYETYYPTRETSFTSPELVQSSKVGFCDHPEESDLWQHQSQVVTFSRPFQQEDIYGERLCHSMGSFDRDDEDSELNSAGLPPPPPPPFTQAKFFNTDRPPCLNNGPCSSYLPTSRSMPAAMNMTKPGERGQEQQKQAQEKLRQPVTCGKQFLLCLLSNQDYRKQRQREAAKLGSTNSTSKIDSAARILFPLSFGLFNFVYWYSYFQAPDPHEWISHNIKGNVLV